MRWHVLAPAAAAGHLGQRDARRRALGAAAVLALFMLVSAARQRALPARPADRARTGGRRDLLRHAHGVAARPAAGAAAADARDELFGAIGHACAASKENFERDGAIVRDVPRLAFGGAHLADPERDWAGRRARPRRARAGRRRAVTLVASLALSAWVGREHGTLARALACRCRRPHALSVARAAADAGPDRAGGRPGGGADGPLSRARHRPHRQRRAGAVAQERAHRVRDRHAVDAGDGAARAGAGRAGGLLQGLGRRGGAVPVHGADLGARTCC